MKFKDLFTKATNSKNNQNYLIIKKRQMKKAGLTPDQLMDMKIPAHLRINKPRRKIKFK
ncbi:MAG: hypothetical protein ACP5D2_02370 [Candidatus Nanoarchaeia archaeon]